MSNWRILALALLLAACGGGGVAVVVATVPGPAAPAPVAVAPPGDTTAPTPAPPQIVTPAWVASWQPVLAESWGAPQLGGWIRQEHAPCAGGLADPGSGPVQRFGVPAGGWAIGAGTAADFTPTPEGLRIDSTQPGAGWGLALLSALDLDPARPIRLAGVVDLQPDDGAWVGLAVHNGEGNYREGGLAWFGSALYLLVHAPCYVVNVGAVQPGARLLATEYHPAHGWRISVDGVPRYSETIDHRNNRLRGSPRAGVWAVNLAAEAGHTSPGRVRALLGTVTVSQGAP